MVSFPRIPFFSSRSRTTSHSGPVHSTSTSPPAPRSATPNPPPPGSIPRYATPNPAPTAPIPIPVSYAHKRRVSAPTRPQTAPIPTHLAANSRAPHALVTKHALAAHTHVTVNAEFEPDDAWKQRLRKDIEESLRSMVDAAKQHVQAKLDAHPTSTTAERRDVIANEHIAAMKTIRSLAEEQYRLALARERAERQWAAGQPIDEDWSDALAQEQQAIMAKIERERNHFGPTSYQSTGKASGGGSYSRYATRPRTSSSASQAVPVAGGGSYSNPSSYFPSTRARTPSAASQMRPGGVEPSTSAGYRTWAPSRPRTPSVSADKAAAYRPWTPSIPAERSASARPWTPSVSAERTAASYRPWTPNVPAPAEQTSQAQRSAMHHRSASHTYGQLPTQPIQTASSTGSTGSNSSHASGRGNRSASASSNHSQASNHSSASSASSSLEPNSEWKNRLRTTIEASLQPILASAKASFQAQLASTLTGALAEEKDAFVREHRAAMHTMRALAEEQFQLALERERSERRWAAGYPLDEGLAEAFAREQQAIMDKIAKERSMSGLGHGPAPGAGPSGGGGGYTAEEKGKGRQRSASAAPAASYGASSSRAGPSNSASIPAADRVRAAESHRPPSPLRTAHSRTSAEAPARGATPGAPVRMPTPVSASRSNGGAFEIWKPSITREEDALQSKPYSVARRMSRV